MNQISKPSLLSLTSILALSSAPAAATAEEKAGTVSRESTIGASILWDANGSQRGLAPSGGALRLQHSSGWSIEPAFGIVYTQADEPLNQWNALLRLRAPLVTRARTRLSAITSASHTKVDLGEFSPSRSIDFRWGLALEHWIHPKFAIGVDASSPLAQSTTFDGETVKSLGPAFAPEFQFLVTFFL